MNQLERTISSVEVAEMVGRTHDNVLKDIRNIIAQIGNVKSHESYFIETTYINSQNKELPCFDLTKKGCELYSTRMTGAKGTQFAVAYIERFNEMEKSLKAPNSTKVLLQASLEHEERLESIEEDITILKTETIINSSQRKKLQGKIQSTVIRALSGMKSNAYRDNHIRSAAYSNIHRDIRQTFDVATYTDIPKTRLEEALQLIPRWRPSLELQARIDHANGESDLWEAG